MIRALALAALVGLHAAGCRAFSGQEPQNLDTQGVHLVQHAPGTCELCDLYLDAREFVVAVTSGPNHGTGIVVADSGAVVTSSRVVDGTSSARVTTYDGRTFDTRVAARDSEEDLALLAPLEVQSAFLAVQIEIAAEPAVGSEVWIIGHPQAYGWTVSRGIVSALREVDGRAVIQTDAALSPGSSGGGLLDAQGRLVGIVTSKVVAPGAERFASARPVHVLLAFLERTGVLSGGGR